ncbi:hypothetical protein Goshw_022590 [Gossypium schwendimanii]|uniref:Major facilitator superfamily (MFS) profile domain-containing protein n=1 Tax=Gossypium schwendimanii TaxID=34291 RepID=A0A7J9LXK1_GOSSC|nr:hypothetical protein [Gossypium schwendimanii]
MPLCYYRQHLQKKRERQVFAAPPEEMGLSSSSSTKDPPATPSWFTPERLLILFYVVNMIDYVDQGVIASNGVNGSVRTCDDKGICTSGSGIQGEFDLTNFQDCLLSSAFMVGLLVASPIFASLTKSHHPFRLIGVGLSVWTLAAAGCGSAFSFWFIAICFRLVGVGEASFISLAAPFIDDSAPVSQKTAWLAMFYICIPTGIAVGYVYGGFVASQFNWRYAFWGEALLMLPFAVFGFAFEPLQLKESGKCGNHSYDLGDNDNLSTCKMQAAGNRLIDVVLKVVYVALVETTILHPENADMMFGGITIVCGILGTLSGGFILDRLSASIYKAFIAPVNYVSLHCVKPSLRPLSMAISTVSIHIFGDVPSSPLMGVLQDNINNWRASALILTSILFLAAGIWFIVKPPVSMQIYSKLPTMQDSSKCFSASNDRSESQVCTVTVDNGTPLLYGNGDESSYEA